MGPLAARLFVSGALAAVVIASPIFARRAEAAPVYPWCAHYMMKGGAHNCSFGSLQECLFDVNGIGGSCQQNPYYLDLLPQRVRKLRHAKRHSRRS